MLAINLNNLNYQFDNNGNTAAVNIGFVSYDTDNSGNSINAYLRLLPADLEQDKTFDDYNKKQLTEIGRKKLAALTAYTEPTATPTTAQ
ncbi:hypothetical protein [Liquorilactobacillus capillatus]|uniref:Uncharacterized protein n=1 Tax=Liquorilactobacillus capillatus DSM 19910 TaxID=1423731 RepID=A0A0R1M444_9LACO|nr:hypothetical protein [Liquorilactobacillus capillatus]KRL02529.1 hypothetical protein FC81_GL000697 [Liquorilactobacillus capillatus DSM 19910]